MKRTFFFLVLLGTPVISVASFQCARTAPVDPPAPISGRSASSEAPTQTPDSDPPATPAESSADSHADAATEGADRPWSPPLPSNIDGPHEELTLEPGRPIFYALPRGREAGSSPLRRIAHLHGMCGAPSYACGKWLGAGTEAGIVICPTGNARCGDSGVGPPSWEGASWPDLVATMDADLEAAIARVGKRRRDMKGTPVATDGAVLTGYSRGAFAAPVIARKHPGRWPYLVLIEANAPLAASSLRASGVRAIALVAGEQGNEIAGMRKTADDLDRSGFPAKLFVMRRTGHLYSDDMEHVMHAALAFVLSHERPDAPDGGSRTATAPGPRDGG